MIPARRLGLHLGNIQAPVQVEIFLDFTCPFSKKAALTWNKELIPKYNDKVYFVVHNVVQPWHHQSIWVHEAAAVVREIKKSAPEAWKFYVDLFDSQDQWMDGPTHDLTKTQFYEKLASFASEKTGIPTKELLSQLLPPAPSESNLVTKNRLVKNEIKYHRSRSVHVTPTVFVNGIEATDVSSGWTLDQWSGLLDPLVASSQ